MVAGSDKQSGVALVLAMMIVALIAVVAVEISWRFELSISRSGNRWHGIQAKAYLEGAEHLAMVVLKEDLEGDDSGKADHLGETWAQQTEPFPTDHGWVSGTIEDAHGRLNLNLLQPQPNTCRNGEPPAQSGQCPLPQSPCDNYTPAQQLLVRLLQTFNLADEGEEPVFLALEEAEMITEAVIDWLDEDAGITGFGGAESDYYEQLESPVAIANTQMVSVSELQVIKGVTPPLYRQLLPNVIALPKDLVNRVNINTAKPNLVRSIRSTDGCDLTPHDAEVGQRLSDFLRTGEFTDWQAMKDDPGLPAEWSDAAQEIKLRQELFTFGPSEYFLLFGETGIGEDHVRRGQSLIRRSKGGGQNREQSNGRNPGQSPSAQVSIEVVRRSDANF